MQRAAGHVMKNAMGSSPFEEKCKEQQVM